MQTSVHAPTVCTWGSESFPVDRLRSFRALEARTPSPISLSVSLLCK